MVSIKMMNGLSQNGKEKCSMIQVFVKKCQKGN